MGKIAEKITLRSQRGYIGNRRVLFPRVRSVTQRIMEAFEHGRNGYLHNFAASYLNQLSTGTTPVTAVTDPAGFVADTRLGMALGSELVTNGEFLTDITGWNSINSATLSWVSGGYISVTSNGALFGATSRLITGFVIGSTYKLTSKLNSNAGPAAVFAGTLAGGGSAILTLFTTGTGENTLSGYFVATATSLYIGSQNGTATSTSIIDYISVRLFEGNHAIQATAGARPTWQVDATGHYYLSFLGTDDSLTSATGGGGSAGIFWCGVVQPTGGAGTARYIFSDAGANTGYIVAINAANKLSLNAGNGVTYTGNPSTATIDVGTKYLLTVWDDGVNLNVQINSAAVETVARPVVVAGTAGFTIGKANGAASNYLTGNLYPSVYWKDTAGTAAERADAQAYCRMMGGL